MIIRSLVLGGNEERDAAVMQSSTHVSSDFRPSDESDAAAADEEAAADATDASTTATVTSTIPDGGAGVM